MPSSIREETFCTSCSANDYIIPGIEFDEQALTVSHLPILKAYLNKERKNEIAIYL